MSNLTVFEEVRGPHSKILLVKDNKCVREVNLVGGVIPPEREKQLKAVYGPYMFHLCGYVAVETYRIPQEWLRNGGEDLPVDAHGGITYLATIGEWTVFGFDCGHFGDAWEDDLHNPEYVMKMCDDLNEQIEAVLPKALPPGLTDKW